MELQISFISFWGFREKEDLLWKVSLLTNFVHSSMFLMLLLAISEFSIEKFIEFIQSYLFWRILSWIPKLWKENEIFVQINWLLFHKAREGKDKN